MHERGYGSHDVASDLMEWGNYELQLDIPLAGTTSNTPLSLAGVHWGVNTTGKVSCQVESALEEVVNA